MTEERTCPACAATLTQESHGAVTVDHCHGCGGVWFDAGELRRMVASGAIAKRAHAAPRANDPAMTLHCPRCSSAMLEERRSQGVPAHACAACGGIFVPYASLQAIAASLQERRYTVGDAVADVGSSFDVADISMLGLEVVVEAVGEFLSGLP